MKKFLILLVFVLGTLTVSAQQKIYCQLVGTQMGLNPFKIDVSVDFGQARKLFSDRRLVDKDGNVIKFVSMIDALNYMGSQGWSFEQAYTVTMGNSNVYHYLLSKEVETEEDVFSELPRTRQQVLDSLKVLSESKEETALDDNSKELTLQEQYKALENRLREMYKAGVDYSDPEYARLRQRMQRIKKQIKSKEGEKVR